MKKTVRIGTIETFTHAGRKVQSHIHCTIEIATKSSGSGQGKNVLTISGVIGALASGSGNCRGGCGQILDEIKADQVTFADGWDGITCKNFLDIWKRWHLNDLRAGCQHQREEKWEDNNLLMKPCPVCGYKYGSQWLYEELPQEVIDFLTELPMADIDLPTAWQN